MRPSRRQTQLFARSAAGRPPVTAILVAASVGAFVSQLVITFMLREADGKAEIWRWLALDFASLRAGEYWSLFTFPLLHAGPLHLLGLVLLHFAGREVEPIVGGRHLFGIYALGTIVGGAAHVLAMPAVPLVGTCAGVTAVLMAFCTIMPELEVRAMFLFLVPVRLRARHLAFALALMNAVLWYTFTLPAIGPVAMLAAGLAGWLYVKQLGFGNPLPIQRYIFEKRERAARLDRMSPDQFMTVEVDPILEKISREGLHSLTRSERKLLALGREKIARKVVRK